MNKSSQSSPPPVSLTCLIERDDATNLYVGHCLTFDLVSTSRVSWKEAWSNLLILIKRHIEYSYTHHRAGFFVSADDSDWTRLQNLLESGKLIQGGLERIEVTLNEPWTSPMFWADVKVEREDEASAPAVPACS